MNFKDFFRRPISQGFYKSIVDDKLYYVYNDGRVYVPAESRFLRLRDSGVSGSRVGDGVVYAGDLEAVSDVHGFIRKKAVEIRDMLNFIDEIEEFKR